MPTSNLLHLYICFGYYGNTRHLHDESHTHRNYSLKYFQIYNPYIDDDDNTI